MSVPAKNLPEPSRSSLPRDPHVRRRLFARSAARILVTTVALLVIYAVTPVPGRSDAGAVVGMIVGLVAFIALLAWQFRSIVRARNPELRAVESVVVSIVVLVVVFAFTYLSLARDDPANFSEGLSRVAALYFTVSTLGTVGFGDIAARSDAARIVVTIQMLVGLAVIAAVARLMILAVRVGLSRQAEDEG